MDHAAVRRAAPRPSQSAPVGSAFDFDRDGKVDPRD
jgi:hypothetical protein